MRQYKVIPSCDRGHLYHKKDNALLGVCDEVGDMLYSLIRMRKPSIVIETGTHVGDSAERIGQALAANQLGHLHTCDTDPEMTRRAQERLINLPVTVHNIPGTTLIHQFPGAEFYFIDSGDQRVRLEELFLLNESVVPPMGIVAWHDACVDYQMLYEQFSAKHDWPHLILPSIVGIAIFQRPPAAFVQPEYASASLTGQKGVA